MITKFDTGASAPASTGSANGTNTLVILVVAAIVVYKFVIKPAMDKKKEEAAKTV